MDKYTIAPPLGSTNNSVGAVDRPWKSGHFDSVKLNGGDLGEYLAESTGYGIVSGCEPSISGLTVTVAAGVVHLADGTRKEISASSITLDAADSTNPRIDLVYITSAGEVAKATGTAAASPSAPSLPTDGISVCNVSVAAGATTGTVTDSRSMLSRWYNTGIVNVKDFGAKGDGVTDDTAAIQAAIDAGEYIYFSPGNYLINVTTGINLHDDMILDLATAELTAIPTDTGTYTVINVHNCNNVKILGGTIAGERDQHTGTAGEWGHGINIVGGQNVIISNAVICDMWGDGVYIGADDSDDEATFSSHIKIEQCEIYNCRRQGSSVVAGNNIIFDKCYIHDTNGVSPQCGIDVEPNGSVKCKNVVINNCDIKDNAGKSVATYKNYDDFVLINNCRIDDVLNKDYSVFKIVNSKLTKTCVLESNTSFDNCEISGIHMISGRIEFNNCRLGSYSYASAPWFSGRQAADPVGAELYFIMRNCYIQNLSTDPNNTVDRMELRNNVFFLNVPDTEVLHVIRTGVTKNAIISGNTFLSAAKHLDNAFEISGGLGNFIFENNKIDFAQALDGGTYGLMKNSCTGSNIIKNNVFILPRYATGRGIWFTATPNVIVKKDNVLNYKSTNSVLANGILYTVTATTLNEQDTDAKWATT